MSKHFHGQSHMKGRIDIDVDALAPNAKYWRMYAEGTYKVLEELVGEEDAKELVYKDEDEFKSWKEMCLTCEKILAEQRQKKMTATVMANIYSTIEGKELLAKTQKMSTRIWSIVRCRSCGTKYDIRLVRWVENSPPCPNCGNHG